MPFETKFHLMGKHSKNFSPIIGRLIINKEKSIDQKDEILLITEEIIDSSKLSQYKAIILRNKLYKLSISELVKVSLPIIVVDERENILTNGDIIKIFNFDNENSIIQRLHRGDSNDNVLFLTNACNSNCIFCPDSEKNRRNGIFLKNENAKIISLLPTNLKTVVISGGEPTLLKNDFIEIFNQAITKFTEASFLLLTNGKMFYYKDFVFNFLVNNPKNLKIAIPIYASTSELHDKLTQSSGSFRYTMSGVNNLLNKGQKIEIRYVLNKMNYLDLNNTVSLVISSLSKVSEFNIMSLELLGNAAKNYKELWIEKEEIKMVLGKAIRKLMKNGISPSIYNFPLCYLEEDLWQFASKSISDYKVAFYDECMQCLLREKCGGFFSSTLKVARPLIYPLIGESNV